ncbi:MAG: winged helix-turn-helix transcriptional regulator [Candidatus Lokiarchaeota archaeon]|nr:winged helix-turn-helix transcriptional regulator [Candidatus Lokiarchaeota archaeon]
MIRVKFFKKKKIYTIIFLFFTIGYCDLEYIKQYSIDSSPSLLPNKEYNFYYIEGSNFFNLNISSNESMLLNIKCDSLALATQSKQLKINISVSNFVEFNFTAFFNWDNFKDNFPENSRYNDYCLDFLYNTTYKIKTNDTISKVSFQFIKIPLLSLEPNSKYSIAYYTNQTDLKLVDTNEINGLEYNYLEASIENLQNNKDYYITIYKTTEITTFNLSLIITLSILIPISIISIISIISVISKKEYIRTLKKRTQFFPKGVHRLSLDEVLENENRNKIIDLILETPGMHFNELLRKTNLNPGNLVWHLEILNVYKVIKKQTMENYVVYLPYIEKNPISNIDLKLQKSEFTLKILKIIEDDPGIWNTKISENLNINRKTIEYHIRKLEDLGLIYGLKEGNKNKLFPNFNADFFIDRNKKDSLD